MDSLILLDLKGLAYITKLGAWKWTKNTGEEYLAQAFEIYSIRSGRTRIYSLCPGCEKFHFMKLVEMN